MTSKQILDPKSDDAATMLSWSDRNPATIVKRTPKTITVQRDRVEQLSSPESVESGLAYSRGHGDVVIFVRDEDAPLETYTLRKTGHWVRKGSPARERGNGLWIGSRNYYRDPHF